MKTAIDFGTWELRSLYRRSNGGTLIARCSRSQYAVIANDQRHRDALLQNNVTHAECENALAVFGDEAHRVEWLCREPCAALFPDGRVASDDPPARQMLRIMVDSLLPETECADATCSITVPGGIIPGGAGSTDSDEDTAGFLRSLVQLRGYKPNVVSSPRALMLACGSRSRFTGVAIDFGAESCSIGVYRHGLELAACTLPVGGNWIDTEIARQFGIRIFAEDGTCYVDQAKVTTWKHNRARDLIQCRDDRDIALARLYRVVNDQILTEVRSLLEQKRTSAALAGLPVAIVCGGGSCAIGGYERLFKQQIAEHCLSMITGEISVIPDGRFSIVRGALIAAELESEQRLKPAVA